VKEEKKKLTKLKITIFHIKLILITFIVSKNLKHNQTTKQNATQPSISHSIASSHKCNILPPLVSCVLYKPHKKQHTWKNNEKKIWKKSTKKKHEKGRKVEEGFHKVPPKNHTPHPLLDFRPLSKSSSHILVDWQMHANHLILKD